MVNEAGLLSLIASWRATSATLQAMRITIVETLPQQIRPDNWLEWIDVYANFLDLRADECEALITE